MNKLEHYANKNRCIIPTQGSAAYKVVDALFCGQRLTAGNTYMRFNLMALSQTVTRLKRYGWPINSESMKLASGKTIARYWMEVRK